MAVMLQKALLHGKMLAIIVFLASHRKEVHREQVPGACMRGSALPTTPCYDGAGTSLQPRLLAWFERGHTLALPYIKRWGTQVRVVAGALLASVTRMTSVLAVTVCVIALACSGVHGHVDLNVAGADTHHAGSFVSRTLLQLDGDGASNLDAATKAGLSIAVVILVAVAGAGPAWHTHSQVPLQQHVHPDP
jgi:hypothetical protein